MEEVETIQAERDVVESEFTSPSQDMGKKNALSTMDEPINWKIIDKIDYSTIFD